ncbi:MAG TPA: tRNA threonylcarbamoyladenosine dehydratase [Verrucomicrobiota bacterium]|nr:tRNA threonylcarbamoyladenosine dehydratase [Verrucomicrobiota bacterium]HQL78521.1 tRNA threonylcarbamoyladenosine dehydratase [Verrucomicrobiota bacterium]
MHAHERRFGGIGRLYGRDGLERLRRSHVCVVGVGGVGSWAAEALARSGVGELTLVDSDEVCITNVNRQIQALEDDLGRPKVDVLARRVRAINPDCAVHPLQRLFLESNAEEILQTPYSCVLDAIDSPSRKCLLIAFCRRKAIPVIAIGAAGGRRDPTAVHVVDLAFSSHDRLLQEVRWGLRSQYGFPRGAHPFGVECVLSRERVVYRGKDSPGGGAPDGKPDPRLRSRNNLGTASFVTGTFGFVAAARVVQRIVGQA